METNKILSADVLDIIFEGRNKAYGAYELRKTYRKRITIALLVTVAICTLLLLFSFIGTGKKKAAAVVVADVSLENMKQQEEKKPEPPPPPPPPKAPEPPKVEMAKFTPPKIVKDEEVKEPPPTQEKMEETKIGTVNQEGVKDEGLVEVKETQGTGVAEAPKEEEDYNKVFTNVQIQASYPGGYPAWNKYLSRNLQAEVPVNNGAPAGLYKVVLSFIVDKSGNISEIVAENDPGYGTKEEAIRVLKKGGGWTPAEQNGRKVIYRHRQTITFQVADDN